MSQSASMECPAATLPPLPIVALACALLLAPAAAGEEPPEVDARTAATPAWEPPAEETGLLRVTVDASGAINALVHWKIREGHLVVAVDGATVADRAERKPPRDLLVHADAVPAGEHVVEVRWEVVFRSATDRHHPMGSAPEELGFAVPASGFARAVVTVPPHGEKDVIARLMRRSAGGLQGDTWVEWDGVDPAAESPPAAAP